MNKILNNRIKSAVQRGLNEAFLNLNIDDIEDIEDNSTYIQKKAINNDDYQLYQYNRAAKIFRDTIENLTQLTYIKSTDLEDNYDILSKLLAIIKDTEEKLKTYNAFKISATDRTLYKLIKIGISLNAYSNIDTTIDLNWIDTSNATNMESLFVSIFSESSKNILGAVDGSLLFILDISSWDTSNVTDMTGMFCACPLLQEIKLNFNTKSVNYMDNMFENCTNLEYIDMSKWDTSNVYRMNNMFLNCENLHSIIGIESRDTKSLSQINNVFRNCHNLSNIDLNKWNHDNIYETNGAFDGCDNDSVIIPDWLEYDF